MGRGESVTLMTAPKRRGAKERQQIDALGRGIRAHLTEDLLKQEYRGATRPYTGHCYVASEVFYHENGGKAAGLKPVGMEWEGSQHWWIEDSEGRVHDLTAEQFENPVPYEKGKGRGFLTKNPSRRAQVVIERMREAGYEFRNV